MVPASYKPGIGPRDGVYVSGLYPVIRSRGSLFFLLSQARKNASNDVGLFLAECFRLLDLLLVRGGAALVCGAIRAWTGSVERAFESRWLRAIRSSARNAFFHGDVRPRRGCLRLDSFASRRLSFFGADVRLLFRGRESRDFYLFRADVFFSRLSRSSLYLGYSLGRRLRGAGGRGHALLGASETLLRGTCFSKTLEIVPLASDLTTVDVLDGAPVRHP